MGQRKLTPAQWTAIMAGHLLVTSLVWRDIRNRPADRIRGSKRLWRIATAANSGNSVLYLLFGRKRANTLAVAPKPGGP